MFRLCNDELVALTKAQFVGRTCPDWTNVPKPEAKRMLDGLVDRGFLMLKKEGDTDWYVVNPRVSHVVEMIIQARFVEMLLQLPNWIDLVGKPA